MTQVDAITSYLESLAPTQLSEDWDNVGLLVGDGRANIERVMTCLTVTPATVEEAVAKKADLIITHHPMPFRSLKRLTTDSTVGRIILRLIENRVSIYSAHTAFDSAINGINQQLSGLLGLNNIRPLRPILNAPEDVGIGRFGILENGMTLGEFAALVKKRLRVDGLHVVGDTTQAVERVAIACGSAGQFLEAAIKEKCDTFVTGETNFHTCLEAQAQQIGLILPGHFASERFAMESLATTLSDRFPALEIWASQTEDDPLQWI